MMGGIGNGRIGSIKKQIFLVLGLFFSCSNLSAMCPQTVGSMSIDEGIWNVLSRVGVATNVIESQICTLSITTTTAQNNCILFGQSDIGAGGLYTISSPGVYCMSNDANWSAGTAISVRSSNVTVDMQNHTLNGGASGVSGITIDGGLSNVTIKNGNIVNPTSVCIGIGNNPNLILRNIIIQNMNFSAAAASVLGIFILATPIENILIENCTGYNCPIILEQPSTAIVRGCVLGCDSVGANANITIAGIGTPFASVAIEDCILQSAPSLAGTALFSIINIASVVLRNCISSNSSQGGFSVNNVANAIVSNCVVQQTASPSDGFLFQSGATVANISITNCLAQECFNGYLITSLPGDVGYHGLELTNCVAQNNNSCGFKINNGGTGLIPFIFRNCTANGNAADGFEIGGGDLGAIGYGAFIECDSSENSSNGYLFSAQSTQLMVEHCTAVSNAGFGFFDANGAFPTTNYYIGCRSFVNGTNYSPAIGASLVYGPGVIYYGMNIQS